MPNDENAPETIDDDSEPGPLERALNAMSEPGPLERALNAMPAEMQEALGVALERAMHAGAAMVNLNPLERPRLERDAEGRHCLVLKLPHSAMQQALAPLGGIEGLMEFVLVSSGATTETEGNAVLEDLSLTLRNREPYELLSRTPRASLKLEIVSDEEPPA